MTRRATATLRLSLRSRRLFFWDRNSRLRCCAARTCPLLTAIYAIC